MSSSASSSSPLSSSAASSLTILTANQSDDLVPGEESAVGAWLMSQGFRSGEIRREKESSVPDHAHIFLLLSAIAIAMIIRD